MNRKHIAVIGSGIAGMETAVQLTNAGHKVTIFEKEKQVGGHLSNWGHLFPDFSEPEAVLNQLKAKVSDLGINVVYQSEISNLEKQAQHFVLTSQQSKLSATADCVVIASGFSLFDATRKEEYGYNLFSNVLTSANIEQKIKTNEPILTAQGTAPKRIAIIHCVGSRDAKCGNTYCSKVCCVTGVKQAIELNKRLPDCEIFCFYMDLRLYGSKYDDLYLMAQKEHKIQFIRGRLSEAAENIDKSLQIKAEDTLSGRPLRMNVDMLVLMVGMEPAKWYANSGLDALIEFDANGFIKSENIQTARNFTTQPGIFAAGTAICPMTVNETLENARSAALSVHEYVSKLA